MDQYNAFVTALPLIESVLIEKNEKAIRPEYEDDTLPSGATEAGKGREEEEEEEA